MFFPASGSVAANQPHNSLIDMMMMGGAGQLRGVRPGFDDPSGNVWRGPGQWDNDMGHGWATPSPGPGWARQRPLRGVRPGFDSPSGNVWRGGPTGGPSPTGGGPNQSVMFPPQTPHPGPGWARQRPLRPRTLGNDVRIYDSRTSGTLTPMGPPGTRHGGGNSAYGVASRRPRQAQWDAQWDAYDAAHPNNPFRKAVRASRAAHPGRGLRHVALGAGGRWPGQQGQHQARTDIGYGQRRVNTAFGVGQPRTDIGVRGGGGSMSGGSPFIGAAARRPLNMGGGGGSMGGSMGSLGEGPIGAAGRQRGPDMWRRRPAGGGSGRPEWGY